MKTILIKPGEYVFSNTVWIHDPDVGLVGEEGTIIVPEPNVLAFVGTGDEDIKCSKCDTLLGRDIGRKQLQNLSIRCWKCGHETRV